MKGTDLSPHIAHGRRGGAGRRGRVQNSSTASQKLYSPQEEGDLGSNPTDKQVVTVRRKPAGLTWKAGAGGDPW